MSDVLDALSQMVTELRASSKATDKKKVLQTYDNTDIREIFLAVHHPYVKYFITSKQVKKRPDLIRDVPLDDSVTIFVLLNLLSAREYTGHAAIMLINSFVAKHEEHKELIHCIIDKNLKSRTGTSMINSVYGDLIPVWDIALGESFKEKTYKYVDFNSGDWYASRKLDGLRCVSQMRDEMTLKSKSGNVFNSLKRLEDELHQLSYVVLDGECCIVDEQGNEDFTAIMKEYNKKNHQVKRPKYFVFDCLTPEEFDSGESKTTFMERIDRAKQLFQQYPMMNIGLLEQIQITSKEQFDALVEESQTKGWEGLILRKNVTYKGKRSNDILKVKIFDDAEYIITDIETGPFQVVQDGKEVEIETMTRAVIIHKDNPVGVGSGWSLEERAKYYANPELIIGKEMTVQYFGETVNAKTGKPSLRFPTRKHVFENGRDV